MSGRDGTQVFSCGGAEPESGTPTDTAALSSRVLQQVCVRTDGPDRLEQCFMWRDAARTDLVQLQHALGFAQRTRLTWSKGRPLGESDCSMYRRLLRTTSGVFPVTQERPQQQVEINT